MIYFLTQELASNSEDGIALEDHMPLNKMQPCWINSLTRILEIQKPDLQKFVIFVSKSILQDLGKNPQMEFIETCFPLVRWVASLQWWVDKGMPNIANRVEVLRSNTDLCMLIGHVVISKTQLSTQIIQRKNVLLQSRFMFLTLNLVVP